MMKTAIVCTAVLLLMTATATAQFAGDVYLDDVDGLTGGNILVGFGNVTFNLNLRNNDPVNPVRGLHNGFRLYGSDSSVTWENLTYWEFLPHSPNCWLFFTDPYFHLIGADTIGFTFISMPGCYIPASYDGPFLSIRLALTDSASVGGTLCLDSSWFPPDGIWLWAFGSTVGSFPPSWDGPHCWPIIGGCCLGQRGNVDGGANEQIDIGDLVWLGEYMFTGGLPPPCLEEADIDGSGGDVIDIADLVYMVDYMFNSGAPPADCP